MLDLHIKQLKPILVVINQSRILGISLEDVQDQPVIEKSHKVSKRKRKGTAQPKKAKVQSNENSEPKKIHNHKKGKKVRSRSKELKALLRKGNNENQENEKLEEIALPIKLPRLKSLEIDDTPPKDEKPISTKKPKAGKSTPRPEKVKPNAGKNGVPLSKQINTPTKIVTKQGEYECLIPDHVAQFCADFSL